MLARGGAAADPVPPGGSAAPAETRLLWAEALTPGSCPAASISCNRFQKISCRIYQAKEQDLSG